MWKALAGVLLVMGAGVCGAQWDIQDSGTTADLRGIDSVGKGIAWASGTNGTVLRTEDGGYLWQRCAVPPGAEKLDFRGVQAFDENTAIVMSSGKGDLSRLYKTTDGCQTWKLVFTNPDKEGFWDAVLLNRYESDGTLLGDPVNGEFVVFTTNDKGSSWTRNRSRGLTALPGEGAFAASNSSLTIDDHLTTRFGTGGAKQARIFASNSPAGGYEPMSVPLASGTVGAGVFSISFRTFLTKYVIGAAHFVAVGGDYTKAGDPGGTAAFSVDDGHSWHGAITQPHGYRSAVAYAPKAKAWVTVGPNGTDVSFDDGRNWRALAPGPGDASDADRNWNALSLPFVVGPTGRIGVLQEGRVEGLGEKP
jgi:photosystem II stability/assembly factor-like uncharacterized protein